MKNCIKNKKRFNKIAVECITCKRFEHCLFIVEFREIKNKELTND